jgi:hypothetical protein
MKLTDIDGNFYMSDDLDEVSGYSGASLHNQFNQYAILIEGKSLGDLIKFELNEDSLNIQSTIGSQMTLNELISSINKKVEIADLNFNGDYLICGITYNRLERRYVINARILLKGDKE